jgi:hypothetical protein
MVDIKDAIREPRTVTGTSRPSKPRNTNRRQPSADPEPQPLNRSQAVQGIFQSIAFPLVFVYPADAAAIAMHAEPIGDAMAETAANDPKFAAILDRILKVGPYGALFAAVSPLALQLFANHGYIPQGFLGTIPKDELAASVQVPEMPEEEATPEDDGARPYAATTTAPFAAQGVG